MKDVEACGDSGAAVAPPIFVSDRAENEDNVCQLAMIYFENSMKSARQEGDQGPSVEDIVLNLT